MPKKSVWEMSAMERLRYSLSAKTFNAILLLSLIVSIAAIALGFTFFADEVSREYRIRTWQLSKTAAMTSPIPEIRDKAEAVLSLYDQMTPQEQADQGDSYLAKFSFLQDDTFEAIRQSVHHMQEENDAIAAYVAALDLNTNRMIFIIDGDPSSHFCPPGYWDAMKPEYIDAFVNGTTGSILDQLFDTKPIPSIVTRMEQYGYRCTAGTKLFDINGYPVMIFFDIDMNRVSQIGRNFLWQYMLILLAVTFITGFIMIQILKKTVVKPINDLASVAQSYSREKLKGNPVKGYFDHLDIHTGDEIENLSLTMQAMEKDLADYEQNLTRITMEKERMNTELNLASRIQEGMLPHIFPPYPDRPEFDLFASMDPAREVGGDFYDFFFVDDDHLAMVMADVSGKGIPASLFMMISKTLIKTCVQNGNSPAEALTNVNRQLLEGNEAEMFVTVWLAVLEISTGKGIAANAGHEHPALCRADGTYELVKYRHSPVIGMIDGLNVKEHEFELHPGDSLFVYTDGVPEATNSSAELFGTDRMLDALNSDPGRDAKSTLLNMTEAIQSFVKDAEQFDDITMLCMRYKGPNV